MLRFVKRAIKAVVYAPFKTFLYIMVRHERARNYLLNQNPMKEKIAAKVETARSEAQLTAAQVTLETHKKLWQYADETSRKLEELNQQIAERDEASLATAMKMHKKPTVEKIVRKSSDKLLKAFNENTEKMIKDRIEEGYNQRILEDFYPMLDYCDSSRVRPQMPFVSVVGCGCSGTTLMGSILGRYPHVFNMVTPKCMLPPEVFRGTPYESSLFAPGPKLFSDKFIVDILLQKEQEALCDNKKMILEKTPGHLFFMHRMNAMIPNIKYVCMVRDGRDVVCSMKKEKDNIFEKIYDNGLLGIATVYVEAMKRTMEMKAMMKNMLIVRLEDFTANPEDKLREILGFLGWDHDHAIIDKMLLADAEKTDTAMMRTGDADLFSVRKSQVNMPVMKNTSRWRTELTSEEQKEVITVIRPYLEHFGYWQETEEPCVLNLERKAG